jgi:hypothetical protein
MVMFRFQIAGQVLKTFYECQEVYSKDKEHFEETELEFVNNNLKANKEEFEPDSKECPRCKTPWSITGFGRKRWYDCKPCKDSAENICGKNNPPPFDWTRFSSLYEEKDTYGEDDDDDYF